MVKILQQREIEGALDVRVAHHLRKAGGQVHRQLLVADGVFQNRLVGGLEHADELLLLLFAPTQQRQFPAQFIVGAMAGKLVQKPVGFKFPCR